MNNYLELLVLFFLTGSEIKGIDSIESSTTSSSSKCTGHEGLAGGQSLDLLYENKNLSKNKIVEMYNKKTGKLFEFSFAAPLILKNENTNKIKFGKNYGSVFGTIFQITDDILDEINSFKEIGKTPGKDKKQGKRTLLSILGKIKAIEFCNKLAEEFIKKNKIYFSKYPTLGDLLYYNIEKLKKAFEDSKKTTKNKKSSKYEIVVLKDGERISGKKKRVKRGQSRLFKKR